ncbi:acetylornithine aminotransferase [Podochytrium sp. JEL0797]|nr:acetylornithine aminotransferase [Podochytrium sp. JEL0797]
MLRLSKRLFTTAPKPATNLLGLYPQPPLVFTHGQGSTLFDSQGQSFLDFNAGIAVNALGHNDKDVAEAIGDQAKRLIHLSNLYQNEFGAKCAGKLVENLSGSTEERKEWWGKDHSCKVFFCNSGTEANEAALKFARKHSLTTRPTKHATSVLSFSHAFHGRTMGALSATPNKKYQAPFAPLVPGFVTSPFNDVTALDSVDFDSLCAVIVEPMQGEGGVFPASTEFLEAIRRKCNESGALLIFDEIQCGIGRSGKMFMHHWTPTVNPDILTLAKPLANGLPMGATILRHTVAANIHPGDHGTTFGGGPLATRVACVVLDKVGSPKFLAHVESTSSLLLSRLQTLCKAYPKVAKEVRGKGLLVGLQLQEGVEAAKFADKCRELGNILVITAGSNTVRMAPPLIITKEEVEIACGVFDEVAKKMNDAL